MSNNKDTKKDESRFTIRFCVANPRHREAIKILNEAGRRKASLISDALLFYVRHGTEFTTDLATSPIQFQREIRVAVQESYKVPVNTSLSTKPQDIHSLSPSDDIWQTVNDSLGAFFD